MKSKPPATGEVDGDNTKEDNRGGKPRHQQHKEVHPKKFRNDDTQPRRPKREFDRKSGTGRYRICFDPVNFFLSILFCRGREVSKGGRGAFGAGNVEQDAMEAEKNPDAVVDAVGGDAEAETEDANENAIPEEPEIPTYTLDEYLEKRNAARMKVSSMFGDAKSVRAADESVFDGMVAKASDAASNGKQSRKKPVTKAQTVEVSFKFEPPQQDRGGRGFRSGRSDEERGRGGRGGRRSDGRSGGRGVPRASAALNLDDFPSL